MLRQKAVGLVGQPFFLETRPAGGEAPRLLAWPDFVAPLGAGPVPLDDSRAGMAFDALAPGRGRIRLRYAGRDTALEIAVFERQPCFFVYAISSNLHHGWAPGRPTSAEEARPEAHGHAFDLARRALAPPARRHGFPITWLIDPVVAQGYGALLWRWHRRFGDDIGLLPTSYFNPNARNLNTRSGYAAALRFLAGQQAAFESMFPQWSGIAGADQWVGSLGTNIVRAYRALGYEGLWGIGFDHGECDTDMFHWGAPWGHYRPSPANFRAPDPAPSRAWLFPWTARDLINTVRVPSGSSGAVIFSSDPDDIVAGEIWPAQPEYLGALLAEFAANASFNDGLVFLVHQEDHDACFAASNAALERLLADAAALPITPATLEEVVQWLNLRHAAGEHPAERLLLRDVLRVQEHVAWGRGGAWRPADWPRGGACYPEHLFISRRDAQIILARGSATPLRYLDYAAQHASPEDGRYPQEPPGAVDISAGVWAQEGQGWRYRALLRAERPIHGYPLALWELPPGLAVEALRPRDQRVYRLRDVFVAEVDIAAGENAVALSFQL